MPSSKIADIFPVVFISPFDYAEDDNVPNSITRKALLEAKNRTDFSEAYATPEEFMKAMQELANA